MKRITLLVALLLAGCSSAPVPPSDAPQLDPATARSEYWLAKPAAATVYCDNYDSLWDVCSQLAISDFYSLDRQDYREGVLTTHPMVSKQIWEFWRHDTGDLYYATENTVQAIRRTIHFDFDRRPDGGSTVTPKVVVERFVQPNKRITSTGEYREYFSPVDSASKDEDYWYAIGRDYEMESDLIIAIREKIGTN
jgi:hypothetical protein